MQNATPPLQAKADADLRRFLQMLYGGMTTPLVELATIEGDPKQHKRGCFRRQFHTARDLDSFTATVAAKIEQGHNVYVSVSGYTAASRSAPTHDSSVIFVDDAPEHGPLPWSMYVQTSERSGHGYILVETPLPASERVHLAGRLAAACGGDPSGTDAQQLVRPPGSVNGKPDANGYRSRLKVFSKRTYTVAEIEAAAPETDVAGAPSDLPSFDQAELEYWIGNVDAILGRIKVTVPMYSTLHGDGGKDRSRTRWGTAHNLRKYWGMPSIEILAVLLTHCDWGHSREKGSQWLYNDCLRCIAAVDADESLRTILIHKTGNTRNQPAQPIPDVPRQSRARKDRPQVIDVAGYFEWLHSQIDACSHVFMKRKDIAIALGISVSTVDRFEKQLRDEGKIRRITRRKGVKMPTSCVVVLDAINIPEPAPEIAAPVVFEMLSDEPRNMVSHARKVYHTAPIGASIPPSPQPRLADAIAEFFEAYPGVRPTLARVRRYLGNNYPDATWTPSAIGRLYRAAMERRAWQRQIERLKALKQKKLDQQERWVDRILAGGRAGPEGKKYGMAAWLAPHIRAEQERRGPMLERLKAGQHARMASCDTTRTGGDVGTLMVPANPHGNEEDRAMLEPPCIAGTPMHSLEPTPIPFEFERSDLEGISRQSHSLKPEPNDRVLEAFADAGSPIQSLGPTPAQKPRGDARGRVCSSSQVADDCLAVVTSVSNHQDTDNQSLHNNMVIGIFPSFLDPESAPGVRMGYIAQDDPWFIYQRAIHGQGAP